MSDSSQGRLLHIRSLNYLVSQHQLTYVGARILAESIHPDVIGTWSQEYIARKAQTKRRQVYWKYSLFKEVDESGKYDYRKCIIGSPTSQLTEVWLLRRLSQEPAFALHPNVYSYCWDGEKSTRIFRYYFKGYMEREHGIAHAASEMTDARVVILDLRRFYPSVDVGRMRDRFRQRVERSGLSRVERNTAIQCVEELTSIKNERGLPIGPPLSHALANVFLEDFDKVLSEEFDGRYFRYVDDVALVVPATEADSARTTFERVAQREGLEVNWGKLDILTGQEWADRVRHRQAGREISFGQFLSDLRRYLAHNTEDFDRVRRTFQAEEFVLPFTRLRSVALSSSAFRRFLKSVWSREGGLFGHSIPRPPDLLGRARLLRREIEGSLRVALGRRLPSGGMSRRWAIQDIRCLLNRSLYVLPAKAREDVLALLPDCPELAPSRAVLKGLVTGDASELTKYPGPTVSSFCELWKESTTERPSCSWSSEPTREERDGASVLALCGLCTPPEAWSNQLRERSSRVMVALSAGQRSTRRTFDDFSYIDEMETLFLRPGVDIGRILSTRFDDGEDVALPTLSLGSNRSFS